DAERVRRLETAERACAPGPVPLEDVLAALVGPMLWIASRPDRGGPGFLRLLGRTYNEPDRDLVRLLRRDHGAALERFPAPLPRRVPQGRDERVLGRCSFVRGGLADRLGGDGSWRAAAGRRRRGVSRQDVLRELMPFLVAGFAAPKVSGAELQASA